MSDPWSPTQSSDDFFCWLRGLSGCRLTALFTVNQCLEAIRISFASSPDELLAPLEVSIPEPRRDVGFALPGALRKLADICKHHGSLRLGRTRRRSYYRTTHPLHQTRLVHQIPRNPTDRYFTLQTLQILWTSSNC